MIHSRGEEHDTKGTFAGEARGQAHPASGHRRRHLQGISFGRVDRRANHATEAERDGRTSDRRNDPKARSASRVERCI